MFISTAKIVAKQEQFQKLGRDAYLYNFLLKRTLELLEVVIAVSVLTQSYFE